MSSHDDAATRWRLPAAVAVTTFATLCAELDLTRLISLLFLRADAYWVIAVALLGFGIGGAVVAVAGPRLAPHADALLPLLMQALGVVIALVPVGLRRLEPRLAGPLTDALLRAPLLARVAATLALILPLGLFMGMLFPSGVRLLGRRAEAFVPWAWGINGSASVIGTLLSLFLALRIGFSALMGIAVAVYVVAALAALGAARRLGA